MGNQATIGKPLPVQMEPNDIGKVHGASFELFTLLMDHFHTENYNVDFIWRWFSLLDADLAFGQFSIKIVLGFGRLRCCGYSNHWRWRSYGRDGAR